jgi:VIT1/CCC1 family predicted Fe2+/Mn2+ transporter
MAKRMPQRHHHGPEHHRSDRAPWLRAAVLGADDGIVSVAALVVGVLASGARFGDARAAGVAGLVAGALSMAAGEYVSVAAQRDVEEADLAIEARELVEHPASELAELAGIWRERGLPAELADEVARELTRTDALGAHARDELGLTEETLARPWQAAGTSAVSFAAGAAIPLLALLVVPGGARTAAVVLAALVALAVSGALGARAGGAHPGRAALRVIVGGAVAMAVTLGIGEALGAVLN